jgi:hypothetical protein
MHPRLQAHLNGPRPIMQAFLRRSLGFIAAMHQPVISIRRLFWPDRTVRLTPEFSQRVARAMQGVLSSALGAITSAPCSSAWGRPLYAGAMHACLLECSDCTSDNRWRCAVAEMRRTRIHWRTDRKENAP